MLTGADRATLKIGNRVCGAGRGGKIVMKGEGEVVNGQLC